MSQCLDTVVQDNDYVIDFAESGFNHQSADYLDITITDVAKEKIIEKVKKKQFVVGIKIFVINKGCGGLSYKMEYAEIGVNIAKKDECLDLGNTKLFIDFRSSLFMFGLKIDYYTDIAQSGFKFSNPTSSGSCKCGESFFV